MKKFFIMSVLILISTSLMAAEEADNKEQKVTATAKFDFKAGDVLSKKEISERLRRELLRNQQVGQQSSRERQIQKRDIAAIKRNIEATRKAENR